MDVYGSVDMVTMFMHQFALLRDGVDNVEAD